MADLEALRAGVRGSLPELALIENAGLRDKVVEAWSIALAESDFDRIEDIPGAGDWKQPRLKEGSQVEHLRATATMAIGLARGIQQVFPAVPIDYDVLIAGALLHDVGKAFELSPRNLARWKAAPARTGLPAIRHPVYGVHVALTAGLPEAVVHIVGGHSMYGEGSLINTSIEDLLVQHADHAQWRVLDLAELMTGQMFPRK
jgi:putative nucleotidyltransferase with HDIG domain